MNQAQPKWSLDEYLDWEGKQPERNFYYRGEIFAMVAVRQAHAQVTLNLGAAFKSVLRGTPCRAFVADMKLRIDAADAVFYPDVMVSCDARDRATPLWLAHPKLIVEVLSDSTAAFDRGAKFAACRLIDTLEEYALIDIDARRTEVFRRNAEGRWVLYEFIGDEPVEFQSIGVTIDAATLYENVEDVSEAQ
ncbi:Uma2 family endonuclease [Sulfuricystis multivorans]|uniref:Uma2 family endonuclease n=1 Tax=Sulfuricystis multivorans TaxID=2211108 RepID=UPI000F83AFFF|nr:Uma2 family endonuclease [Sulfuricystis multivorans]